MIQVYLVKRHLRKRLRNGARDYRWALRWEDADGWHYESTGTADRTQAEALQKAKWAELNIPEAKPEEPAPEPIKATWDECKEAIKRAMEADNLRPCYVSDILWRFDAFRRMFPEAKTPADVTPAVAQEYKRQRAEAGFSPWTVKSDLTFLKSTFGKWLGRECGLLASNPFANVKPPKCDEPDVRIVSAEESAALFKWLGKRWNNWQLPLVYLRVAALLGWRATETASLREEDFLPDGFVRVAAENCKTRRHKYGWLPADLYSDVKACSTDGWAFGRFPDQLRRLLLLWKKRPRSAALVKEFTPKRMVQWFQDELRAFQDGKEDRFTLHDFRRTAVTGLQMAGVSEKETSLLVGATPEVIRKHYERMDRMVVAKRAIERRLAAGASGDGPNPAAPILARPLRALRAEALDGQTDVAQNDVA